MLEAALAHAKSGRPVFPLWDKKPRISKKLCPNCLGNCENTAADGDPANWVCPNCKCSGGAGYKDATTDPELIAKWWGWWPQAQIGMPTDGYVIVDVDAGEGKVGFESLAALEAEHGKLPETLVQTTPRGGKHYLFKAPEGTTVKNNQSVLGKDIDVRGQGGYIVLAPSMGANGGSYEWATDPASTPIAEAPSWIVEKPELSDDASAAASDGDAALDGILAKMRSTKEGKRNDTLFKLSKKVVKLYGSGVLPASAIEDLFRAAAETGLSTDEIQRTFQSALKNGKSAVNTEDKVAVEFVAKHGANTRYCQGWAWLEYSEDSKVWEKGKAPSVLENIRQICRSLNREENPTFGAARTFKGVAQIVQNDPHIYTTPDQWDSHPWLIGTPSGAVCLNGEPIDLSERELYLTKSTKVAPEKGEPVLWRKFLNEITSGDKKLQRYLQQVTGYGLTGTTREHALFFVYGPGGNGKSVFLNTIENIMGGYAARATMEVFTASKSGFDRHTTDIAMLAGARLVTLSETEEGRVWRESLVKSMTGGDKVTARFMRKDNFTFAPQFKLMVASNNKPKILKVDDAMRRRINIIPFNFRPEAPDMELEKKLEAEYPQILNWMIEGSQDWIQNGFTKPQCVLDETNEYFAEQDLMSQWIGEKCEVVKDATEQAITLFNSWRDFMVGKGEREGFLNMTRFGNEMKLQMGRYGFDKHHTDVGTVYRGISLKKAESAKIQPLMAFQKV